MLFIKTNGSQFFKCRHESCINTGCNNPKTGRLDIKFPAYRMIPGSCCSFVESRGSSKLHLSRDSPSSDWLYPSIRQVSCFTWLMDPTGRRSEMHPQCTVQLYSNKKKSCRRRRLFRVEMSSFVAFPSPFLFDRFPVHLAPQEVLFVDILLVQENQTHP
ncbi:hypothetical protein BC941DRAFT_430329 [Chlamydoabsidia padenii]|nr:hypothetical protein BC941DRAFT_430329 [Chlamydoabsidia padenii]